MKDRAKSLGKLRKLDPKNMSKQPEKVEKGNIQFNQTTKPKRKKEKDK